jgi:poly-gamma-glutamate capsule biosynthesis protein CapA/YwtB (metallophosphatase superfamily)
MNRRHDFASDSRQAIAAIAMLVVIRALPAQVPPQTTLPRWIPDPESQLLPAPLPATVKDGFKLVTLGDLLYWRPVRSQIDSAMESALRLVRDADFATANHEGTFFDIHTKRIPPSGASGGALMVGSPDLAQDIKNLGVGFVSKANNHSVDWGTAGLLEELRLLDAASLPYAGAGANHAAARAAGFVDLPKGRVGVVSAASSFQNGAIPMDEDAEIPARPGISVLRTTSVQIVNAKEMAALQQMNAVGQAAGVSIAGNNGVRGRGATSDQSGSPAEITVLGQTYRLGEKSGRTWTMNKLDHFEILKEVRSAKKLADLVIFTIHAHEGQEAPGEGDTPYPADFLPVLFHNVIDAGADVVAGHGSHALRGIEIYKGRPIFYGLSTFLFQGYILSTQEGRDARNLDPRFVSRGETETRLNGSAPPGVVDKTGLLGSWDVSILPVMTYEGGRVKEIRIYPIDVRRSAQSRQSGLPRIASPELGRRILDLVRELSTPFGTDMRIEGNVGVIRP